MMHAADRLDVAADRSDRTEGYQLAAPTEREDGSIVGEMVVATVGVMDYPWGRCFVPRDVLADPDAIASLRLRPIVGEDTHDRPEVTPEEMAARRIGHIGENVRMEGDDLVAPYVIDTAEGKRLLATGLRGVSPSYTFRRITESGTDAEGNAFDYVQADRRYLHVALVGEARGGERTRIAADGADTMDPEALTTALTAALAPLLAKLDAMTAVVDGCKAAVDAMGAGEEEKEAEADEVEVEVSTEPTDEEKEAAADAADVAGLARLFSLAESHGVPVAGHKNVSALRRAVAAKVAPHVAADSANAVLRGVIAAAPIPTGWTRAVASDSITIAEGWSGLTPPAPKFRNSSEG